MAEVKYINKSVRTYDDEKIKIIESMPEADAILVIWDKLICLAGKINSKGWIYLTENRPYTDEMLATVLSRPLNTVRLAINVLKDLEMIQVNGSGIFLRNFAKWQNLDALERIRENTRKRVVKHRQQQKILQAGNVTNTLRNAIEGEGKEKEKENKKENNTKKIIEDEENGGIGGKSATSLDVLDRESNEKLRNKIYDKFIEMVPYSFGKEPDSRELAQIRDYSITLSYYPDCTDKMVYDAFKEAATHNKLHLSYVYSIIRTWLGIKR